MNSQYKYYAFISYSHKDSEWAKWIQNELEHYDLPTSIKEREGIPETFRPVFRDEDELSGGDLKPQIMEALDDSLNLIVICSPNSAKSKYVNEEIQSFIDSTKNSHKNIFPIIVEGVPYSEEEETECFPVALRNLKQSGIELIAGDVSKSGINRAFVKVLAGTLKECHVQFDELWNRFEREKIEKEKREREEKERLLKVESLYLSERADYVRNEYGLLPAISILVKALPQNYKNPHRPYVHEAESRLYDVYREYKYTSNYKIGTTNDRFIGFNHDGSELLLLGMSGYIDVIDSSTFKRKERIYQDLPEGFIDRVFIAPKGGKAIIQFRCYMNFEIVVFCLLSRTIIRRQLRGFIKATSEDGNIIFFKSGESLFIYNLSDNSTKKIIDIETNALVQTTSDNKAIILDEDGWLIVYDINNDNITTDLKIKQLSKYKHFHIVSLDNQNITVCTPGSDSVVIGTYNIYDGKRVYSWLERKKLNAINDKYIVTEERNTTSVWKNNRKKSAITKVNGRVYGIELDCGTIITYNHENKLSITRIKGTKSTTQLIQTPIQLYDYDYLTYEKRRIVVNPRGDTFALETPVGVEFWSIKDTSSEITSIIGEDYMSYAISDDGNMFVCGLWGGTIKIWVLNKGLSAPVILNGHQHGVSSLSFSNNGNLLISGGLDNVVRIWDIPNSVNISLPLQHEGMIVDARFSMDEKSIITISRDNYMRIWNYEKKEEVFKIRLGGYTKYSISPDNQFVIIEYQDHIFRLVNIDTLNIVGEFNEVCPTKCERVGFTQDGDKAYFILSDNICSIYNVDSCLKYKEIKVKGGNIIFDHSGKHVISSDQGALYIYDLIREEYKEIKLREHQMDISSIACTPDQRHIVIGSNNAQVSLWDITSCRQIGNPLITPVRSSDIVHADNSITNLSFNAQGNKLLAFSGRGDIKIIDFISSQKLLDACRSIISNGCVNQEDQTYHCM